MVPCMTNQHKFHPVEITGVSFKGVRFLERNARSERWTGALEHIYTACFRRCKETGGWHSNWSKR